MGTQHDENMCRTYITYRRGTHTIRETKEEAMNHMSLASSNILIDDLKVHDAESTRFASKGIFSGLDFDTSSPVDHGCSIDRHGE